MWRHLYSYHITDEDIRVLLFDSIPIYRIPFDKIVKVHEAPFYEIALVVDDPFHVLDQELPLVVKRRAVLEARPGGRERKQRHGKQMAKLNHFGTIKSAPSSRKDAFYG
jgi:hypothetical protein